MVSKAQLVLALAPVAENLTALQASIKSLETQLTDLPLAEELEALRDDVTTNSEALSSMSQNIQDLLCNAGVGVDACGACLGTAQLTEECCEGHHTYGSGVDGVVSITSTTQFHSTYSFPMAITPPNKGATTITMSGSNSAYAADQLVLVINLQGTLNDYQNVGNYEFANLASVSGTTLTLTAGLKHQYASSTSQKTFVQIVPQFSELSINALLTTAEFSSTSTGIIAFLVKNELTFSSAGEINVSGLGFASGAGSASGYCKYAYNGQGINQATQTLEGPRNIGGGAGGSRAGSWCASSSEHVAMAGSGGSHATPGAAGSNNMATTATYGSTPFQQLFLGGGGSGSTSYRHNTGSGHGGAGGRGGGIIIALARTISFSSSIDLKADGANGSGAVIHGGQGGGGAGGSIFLQADKTTRTSSIMSYNGGIATGTAYGGSRGGTGGLGRAQLQVFQGQQICHNGHGANADWGCDAHLSLDAYCNALSQDVLT
eukprot:m.72575 g.72575  ORF g.72575 m.72575 type:complete len:489 (+) comp8001_c0_seq2:470-1936(+)